MAGFYRLAGWATLLALAVVVLGAWVRLTDAGLGCPDWPGCYGVLTVPQGEEALARAERFRPDRPVDVGAAWREMVHRYAAGLLGLAVLGLAAMAVYHRGDPRQPVKLPLAILGLIVVQSLLGMWTVTLLLKPLIVMAHLVGGFTTLALLFLLWRRRHAYPRPPREGLRGLAAFALIVLGVQVMLGGWTSANYAALACPDVPLCQGQLWPRDMDFGEAFVMWRGLGTDYEHGVLDGPANTAIHMSHRLGALAVTLVLGALGFALLRRAAELRVRVATVLMLAALLAQLAIGISVVWLQLPLVLATAHNAFAALLVLALVNLNLVLRRDTRGPDLPSY